MQFTADTPQALAYLYARLIDDRAFSELHTIMTPDVRISGPGYTMNTLPEVLAGMEVLRNYDRTFHLVGNHLGGWQGPDIYLGETYCQASHVYSREGREWNFVMAIRYQDRIVRTPAGLRFAERVLNVVFTEDHPLDMK